jgi:hypothetical protein
VTIRADTTKVIAKPERGECPRIGQIRKLSIQNVAAKGPVWARSMTRKLLGNEEFCLQVDAHTKFVQDWDDKVKHEWAATGNEFGIISTVPAGLGDDRKDTEVPRQCEAQFLEIGVPVRSFVVTEGGCLGLDGSHNTRINLAYLFIVFLRLTALQRQRRWKGRTFEETAAISCLVCWV